MTRVADIRRHDKFVENDRLAWTAWADAINRVPTDTVPITKVIVTYPDGGSGVREFEDSELEIPVIRRA